MRAAAMTRFGGPDVLAVHELPRPIATEGHVVVRVVYAGVQPFDIAVRSGWSPAGLEVRFPQVLGNDFAGVVSSVGARTSDSADTDFRVGDAVVGFTMLGGNAEYVAVPREQLVNKPPTADWASCGGLSAVGQTAHTAIEDMAVEAGETVLVHGAAGGVGTVFVQLARLRGATVIGTAAPEHHAYLRGLGVLPIAYGADELQRIRAAVPGPIDAALDAAGHNNLRTDVELVADRRRIGALVDMALADELGCRVLYSRRSAARLAELTALVADGRLRIQIRRAYPLAQAAAAHRDVESGHGRGKVVLAVSDTVDAA